MAIAPYVPPYVRARTLVDSLATDPSFTIYSATPGVPDRWQVYGNLVGSAASRQTGHYANYACRIPAGAGIDNVGIHQRFVPAAPVGWWVLEAVVTLIAGALTGGGVGLAGYDSTYTTLQELAIINFSTDPDINGVINGTGSGGGITYSYRKLVQIVKPTSVAFDFIGVSHGTFTGGSIANNNSFDWSLLSMRPASPQEIAAVGQQQGYSVFPLLPGQTIETEKTPMWSTQVAEAASGRERRAPMWSYAKWAFTLTHDVVRHRVPTNDEQAALWEFFNSMQGQFFSFLYLDPTDYAEIGAPLGTGDGATTAFQLQRSINTWSEPIFAPFGITVYDNGTAKTLGVDYTIGALGVITFILAPPTAGHVLTWDGYFYYIARFLQDDLTLKQIYDKLWAGNGLKLLSQKL